MDRRVPAVDRVMGEIAGAWCLFCLAGGVLLVRQPRDSRLGPSTGLRDLILFSLLIPTVLGAVLGFGHAWRPRAATAGILALAAAWNLLFFLPLAPAFGWGILIVPSVMAVATAALASSWIVALLRGRP